MTRSTRLHNTLYIVYVAGNTEVDWKPVNRRQGNTLRLPAAPDITSDTDYFL